MFCDSELLALFRIVRVRLSSVVGRVAAALLLLAL